jgi:hypothetical protein
VRPGTGTGGGRTHERCEIRISNPVYGTNLVTRVR